jgi:hypothetical protein
MLQLVFRSQHLWDERLLGCATRRRSRQTLQRNLVHIGIQDVVATLLVVI